MGKFSKQLDKNINLVLSELNEKITQVAIIAFRKVVDYSPSPINSQGGYSDGLLVNNWFVARGRGNYSTSTTTSKSDVGAESRSRIDALINTKEFYKKDGSLSLTNNLNYAYRAEVLGWPKGDGGTWKWTGTIGAYNMIGKALIETRARI